MHLHEHVSSQVVRERRPCQLYFDLEYVPAHNPGANGDALLERLLQLLEAALRCAPFPVLLRVYWWERTAGHVIRCLAWASALMGRLLQLLDAALRYGLVVSRSSKAQRVLHMERRRQRAHGAAAAAAGGRPQVQRFLRDSACSAIHAWDHYQLIGAVALPKRPLQLLAAAPQASECSFVGSAIPGPLKGIPCIICARSTRPRMLLQVLEAGVRASAYAAPQLHSP